MLFRSNDTATTEIYTVEHTLSLHDALPIYGSPAEVRMVAASFVAAYKQLVEDPVRRRNEKVAGIRPLRKPSVTTEETTMSDERCEPCTGGDYCGRTTNGYFENGTHGPGWYCGWCAAVPDAS